MRPTLVALVLLAIPLPAASQEPPEAMLMGSSSACGPFGQRVRSELVDLGVHFRRPLCHSATGLARPDALDWFEEVPEDLGGVNVFLFLGGNDAQSLRYMHRREWDWIRWGREEEWRTEYEERTRTFVDALCTAGAVRVFVILPPPVPGERLEGRLGRVRESMERGANASACGVSVDTRGLVLDAEDDYLGDEVHLSRSGSRVAWESIGPGIRSIMGLVEIPETP